MATAYPQEPFRQVDNLISQLLEEYRGSRDASLVHSIQSTVEDTVKIARDREFKAHSLVRELSQQTVACEAAAVYGDAKAQHEQRMAEMNSIITGAQQALQQVKGDLDSVQDQQEQVQQRQAQLQAEGQRWSRQAQDPEPLLLRLISLYAHISGMSFDYQTLDAPVTRAEVTGFLEAGIRNISLDHSRTAFEKTNQLWEQIPCPAVRLDKDC